MKAVRFSTFGDENVLEYGDYPSPAHGPGEVLVRVLATTVSRWDIKYRSGGVVRLPGRKAFPLPMQPGRDAVGIVESVGPEVRHLKPGDPVVGLVHPANPLSSFTIRGLSNLSTDIDYPGHTMFGGNAQFVARPESYWLPLPEGVEPPKAAAAMWAYATSHRILTDRIAAQVGDSVFVVGGSGGMGSATLDLGRAMGVRMIAVTRSAAKTDFLRRCGASDVFVLGDGDPVVAVRKLSDDLGVDGAVDYSGDPRMIRLCVDVLRPGGTLVPVAGEEGKEPLPISAADCVRLELNIRSARASTLNDQRAVLALLAQRKIDPAIDAIEPMSMVRAAHARLAAGAVSGRIVLDPWA